MFKKLSDMSRSDRLYLLLTVVIRLSLVVAILGAVWETAWMTLFVSSLALLLSFLPHFIQRTYSVRLPGEIQIIMVLFIYAALFLGMAREWYHRIWWWDSLMHGLSGVALGFAGFLILYVLYKTGKLQASFFLIALLSFCFAVSMGALWEIFEFGVDEFFGEDMQRARFPIEKIEAHPEGSRIAIYDTMWDMMLNTLGALLASVAGYMYLKNGEIFLFDRLIQKFERVNPELFGKEDGGEEKKCP